MTKLIFFYAYRSPYSALAADMIFEAAKGWGDKVQVTPVQFSLDEDVAFADPTTNPDKVAYIVQDVIRLYAARNLPVGMPDPFDIDFALTARPTHAAIEAGFGLAFIREMSLLRWGEGKNISEADVVVEAADRAGWDGEAARAALADDTYQTHIAADKTLVKQHKVFGVPFFVVEDETGQESFWGQDRWAMICERLGRSD